jgi:hypothetical protein
LAVGTAVVIKEEGKEDLYAVITDKMEGTIDRVKVRYMPNTPDEVVGIDMVYLQEANHSYKQHLFQEARNRKRGAAAPRRRTRKTRSNRR